ncbi:MAG: cupin domain-containing protein [Deltaproteobacteria bacterium]|nr:cupin domain-containing protein [Deltaproteobacteria bacterium]
MKIMHYNEQEPVLFDSDPAKGVAGRVVIGKKDGAENFCMRVFELTEGGFSPRHSHEWEHEIFVHSGDGEVYNDGQWSKISKGFTLFIPGNEEHQMRNTGNEPFVFACLIPSGAPEM